MPVQEKRMWDYLLSLDEEQTKLTNKELIQELKVSEATIQNTLKALEEQKKIRRTNFWENGEKVRIIEIFK